MEIRYLPDNPFPNQYWGNSMELPEQPNAMQAFIESGVRNFMLLGQIALVNGLFTAISAKVLSHFMVTPLFKKAFCFGLAQSVLQPVLYVSALAIHVKVRSRLPIEAPRSLYIWHFTVFSIITFTSIFFIANKKVGMLGHLTIPRNFTRVYAGVAVCSVPSWTCLVTLSLDIYKLDTPLGFERLIDDISFLNGLAPETINAGLRECFNRLLQGDSAERVRDGLKEVALANETQVILEKVLKKASRKNKEAFIEVNVERNAPLFIGTKIAAIYVIGSEKNAPLPSYLSGVIQEIIDLRNEIEFSRNSDSYKAILGHLDNAAGDPDNENDVGDDEDFFAFQSEIESNRDQKKALQALQAIGLEAIKSRNFIEAWKYANSRLESSL